jgi:hypothetical protein
MELVTVANPLPVAENTAPTISVEALMAQVEELKAKLAATAPPPVPEAAPVVPMTVEEAKAFIATFAGKRGRRPATFREAEAIVSASLTDADKAAAKAAAKALKVALKVKAKEEKAAKKAGRALAALNAKAAAAKAATEKVAKVFLRLSTKSEALEAQVKALTAPAAAAE